MSTFQYIILYCQHSNISFYTVNIFQLIFRMKQVHYSIIFFQTNKFIFLQIPFLYLIYFNKSALFV